MATQHIPLSLGTEKIGKLLVQYATPAIIAMTASSLYNIVDSIFLGYGVGPLAISGLAISFPLMNLLAAFGSMVGVGATTLVSVKLGERDYEGANKVLGNVVVLNVTIGLLMTLIFLLMLDPVLYFFGASSATITYARDYMQIILFGNVVTHMYFGLNGVLRSSGFPKLAMYATLASVVINTILNPIFIFGLGWGIKGSAIATVIAQTISLVYQILHFADKQQLLHFQKKIYKLEKVIVNGIISVGMSPFLMNLCSCLVVILINRGLKQYGGDMAIGAYGIANRVVFFFVMVMMGFNQGMQPIAGYNYGAKKYDRVIDVTKMTIYYETAIATIGFVLCEFAPFYIVRMFTDYPDLIKASVFGLKIDVAVFPLVGFQMVATNFFTSIGMAKKAIFLSLTRQMLFLIPGLIILPPLLGTLGVWISLPISDAAAVIVSSIVFVRQIRKFKMLQ